MTWDQRLGNFPQSRHEERNRVPLGLLPLIAFIAKEGLADFLKRPKCINYFIYSYYSSPKRRKSVESCSRNVRIKSDSARTSNLNALFASKAGNVEEAKRSEKRPEEPSKPVQEGTIANQIGDVWPMLELGHIKSCSKAQLIKFRYYCSGGQGYFPCANRTWAK